MNAPLALPTPAAIAADAAALAADTDAVRLREIPYNYTSFSDREIVIRLLGDRAWEVPVSYTHLTLPTNREV